MKMNAFLAFAGLTTAALIGTTVAFHGRTAQLPEAICPAVAKRMARLELIFGLSRPSGIAVSDEDWELFLDTEVTPRFPEGFTVVKGSGQWRSADGRIAKEKSSVLVIWQAPSTSAEASIDAIRSSYKTRFEQESVMRVESTSCVSF
jgi:Protein of unknown function (DUF3574)